MQKAREFMNLKQDKDQAVREYEEKFIQIECFGPLVCDSEQACTKEFVWGLKFAFKDYTASHRLATIAKAVAAAWIAKEVLARMDLLPKWRRPRLKL